MHTIKQSSFSDVQALLRLYLLVANHSGGIIRIDKEITADYIYGFLDKSIRTGIILHVPHPEKKHEIIAEIHAFQGEISSFRHILTGLTVLVHPDFQGQGVGKLIFNQFLAKVQSDFPHILRVELYVREQNKGAIRFYETLGFVEEGRLKHKIKNVDGSLETPIEMTWFNPYYQTEQ